jgi:hypothetical protein
LQLADPNDSILLIPADVPQPPRLPSSSDQWLRFAAAKGRKVGQLEWLLFIMPLTLWCEVNSSMVKKPIQLFQGHRANGAIGLLSSVASNPSSAGPGHQIQLHRIQDRPMQGPIIS